jgi:aspartyl-tRNA(Asn)/glutamyl-tRNA(Gln) amidotransferase subunit C
MPISSEIVEHVAALAQIGLTPDEVEHYAAELSSVLDHVARLQGVDTDGVPPTAHAVETSAVMRDDVVGPCWPVENVLANAPRRQGDFFEVQAVLD